MITLQQIEAARERLRGVTVQTPLVRCFNFSAASAGQDDEEFYLKAESLQPVGSFKLRGAYNKIASLSADERAHGVITHSSGNHAQGVAYAARALGAHAVIVMPASAPKVKLEATRALGAEIVLVGDSGEERHERALALAAEHGYAMIDPFDDEAIIAGQGTAGLEILEQLPDVELVLVPIGGGGISSGVSAAIKLSGSRARVFGVEPQLANDAQQSLKAGRIVRIAAEAAGATIADGLRVQSIGQQNLEHLMAYLDGVIAVSEDEIRQATRQIINGARLIAEPSGAVTTAAWLYHRHELPARRKTVALLSGGNADPKQIAELLEER